MRTSTRVWFVTLGLILSSVVFTATSSSAFASEAVKKKPRQGLFREEMRFVFKEFEGAFTTVCKHELVSENSPYDWKIDCYDQSKKFASYVAHVALTQYRRPAGETRLSVELLYWLTGTYLPYEVGSTTWFHFRDPSLLQEISSSQTVDRGMAGLYLEVLPGQSFRPKKKKP